MAILEGRTAIVVGASSGVGYGCALRFAEEGAHYLNGQMIGVDGGLTLLAQEGR
jgi:NADP-dependent 3-hydroxy acid dehydrogenase YdfG